jgi:hypothetical protein
MGLSNRQFIIDFAKVIDFREEINLTRCKVIIMAGLSNQRTA